MRLVARVRNRHAGLRRSSPAEIELDAGVLVYAGRTGGAFELRGDLSTYPISGDDLVGPAAGAPSAALRGRDAEEVFAHDADGTSVTVKNVKVDLGQGPQETCALVPSSDGHVYATCNSGAVPLAMRTPNAWVRVARASTLKVGTEPHLCVARDGAIWAWEGARDLTRVLPDGRKEQVPLPRASAESVRASYDGSYPEMMSATWARGADGGVRFWQSTRVVSAQSPREVVAIQNMVPLDDGSVWALGWEGGHTEVMVLMRAGQGTSTTASEAHAALREVGSPFDQENEVRNTKEPRPWTSRCQQVFVAFDVATHQTEAKEARLARKHRLSVDVVSGRLAGRTESGVLFLRSEPESSPAALETAVAKLLLIPRAEAFCTAPVLDRVLDRVIEPP